MKTTLQTVRLVFLIIIICLITAAQISAQLLYQWANGFAPTVGQTTEIKSVTTDASGNVYATGFFTTTVDFDPSGSTLNLTSAGGNDVFVAKYNAAGNLVWVFPIGSTNYETGFAITLDVAGNIIITGTFRGTVDFDPSPVLTTNLTVTSSWDFFIAKFTPAGTFMWAKGMGGFGNDEGWSLATDAAKNIYVTGIFSQSMDCDPSATGTDIITSAGINDCFFAKYDSSGNYFWAHNIGGTLDDVAGSIAVSNAGNVYVAGAFRNTADFDPSANTVNKTSNGVLDIFIAQYNNAGNYVWAHNIGGTLTDQANSIKLDASGNLYVTGSFEDVCDFDPSTTNTVNLQSAGSGDIFLAKYNAAGSYVWAKNMGGQNDDSGTSLNMDAYGNLFVSGRFTVTADFDPSANTFPITTYGGTDAFISKYNNTGNLVWAHQLGGPNDDGALGASISSSAPLHLYVGGFFHISADMDPSANVASLQGPAAESGFLAKYTDVANSVSGNVNMEDKILVYPNPSSGRFYLELTNDAFISVYNSFGAIVMKQDMKKGNRVLSLSHLPRGFYIAVIISDKSLQHIKLEVIK